MKLLILCLSILFLSFSSFGGETEYSIRADKSFIAVNASSVFDLSVSYPSAPILYGNYDQVNLGKVSLDYNRELHSDLSITNPWRYEVTFSYVDANSVTQTETLKISYESGNYVYQDYALIPLGSTDNLIEIKYENVEAFYHNGSAWVSVTPQLDPNLPIDIHLELSLKTTRYYELDEAIQTPVEFNIADSEVRWNFIQGAEEYDLEWVFIDELSSENTKITNGVVGIPLAQLPFELKEPTRVRVKDTRYIVDLIYPKGTVYFRVRPVGRFQFSEGNTNNDYETVKTGNWSYHTTNTNQNDATISKIEINLTNEFSVDKNWIYGVNFAENGKSVTTIGYFDGSLRGRQNLAYNTSDNVTLIGESKFDYEGRQTVSVIPAPVQGRSFGYENDFNGTFTASNFDNDNPQPLAIPLASSGTKGSAQYFSPENTFANNEYRDATPNANGYVYSQVKFNKDATGRVSEVAGIGSEFAIGSGHTIKYYYENAKEIELRRLFGDEVGYASNYKKNIVIDANGQGSVSYIDNHGRVIATALIGDKPDNLKEIPVTFELLSTPIITNNVVDNAEEQTSITTFSHISNLPLDYSFTYDMEGIIYGVTNPDPNINIPLCFACEYELEFYIKDPSGNVVTTSYQQVSFNSSTYASSCNPGINYYSPDQVSVQPYDLGSYTISEIGEYTIVKKLTVNTATTGSNIVAAIETQIGTVENYILNNIGEVDLSGCYSSCDSVCYYEMMYTVNSDPTTPNWDDPSTDQAGLISQCLSENCDISEFYNGDAEDVIDQLEDPEFEAGNSAIGTAANCQSILNQMEDQLRPGGIEYLSNDFWSFVSADLPSGNGTISLYETYTNGVGNGTLIDDVNFLRDEANFQEDWLTQLLPYHREYCHYSVCIELESTVSSGTNSNEFQAQLFGQGPWSVAYTAITSDNNSITNSLDPLNGSDIETLVTGNGYVPFVNTLLVGSGNFEDCSISGTFLNIDDYTDVLWNCQGYAAPVPNSQEDFDKWSLYVGNYINSRNIYINWYKEHINGLSSGDALWNVRGCLYFDDEDAIVLNPVADIDTDNDGVISDAEIEIFSNNLQGNNIGAFTFDCGDVCNTNVDFWLNSFNSECMASLSVNNISTLTSLLMDYCSTSCEAGNVGGWFYNNLTPEYTAVETFLNGFTECGIGAIEIDSSNISVSTSTVIPISICLSNLIDFINLNLPLVTGGSNTVSLPTDLSTCLGGISTIDIGSSGSRNIIGSGIGSIVGCKNLLIITSIETNALVSILDGGLIDLLNVSAITDFTPSQIDQSLAFANVIYTANGITQTINVQIEIAPCLQSSPVPLLEYTQEVFSTIPDCIQEAYAMAAYNAEQEYNALFGEMFNSMISEINCMDGILEDFRMEYILKESYYTLYYYDQSGSLVSTVPPEGVHPLSQTNFDAAYQEYAPFPVLNPNFLIHGWVSGISTTDHSLQTTYQYNGLNQLVSQSTPDGGVSHYYYDDLYRLRFSRNAKQITENKFSYSKFDELGRVIEAGEAGHSNVPIFDLETLASDPNFNFDNKRWDYTQTTYESGNGDNLRNRIASVKRINIDYLLAQEYVSGEVNSLHAFVVINEYSYDIHGNVKEFKTIHPELGDAFENFIFGLNQHEKTVEYKYDLISGNVNEVIYQKDQMDEWRHAYHYDANNRLIRAFTSDDGIEWDMDAKYFYYLHGPLARVETGHDKIQGTDYVYNLQGWLKGVNSTTLESSKDAGHDGQTSDLDQFSGQDAYGYSLGYYLGDYNAIGSTNSFANVDELHSINGVYGNLFNGNISNMVTALKNLDENKLAVLGNNYTYDQLNRIRSMDVFWVQDQAVFESNNSFNNAVSYQPGPNYFGFGAYATSYTYDLNGNLKTLIRKGASGDPMDNLTYDYNYDSNNLLINNQLNYVSDGAGTTAQGGDIGSQPISNYDYDEIGQLIKDEESNILEIIWSVDGKVKKIIYDNGADAIYFFYDALGNRTHKIIGDLEDPTNTSYEYYMYDASGNVMANYGRELINGANGYEDKFKLKSRNIYGSKRLGQKVDEDKLLAEKTFVLVQTSFFTYDVQRYSGNTGPIEHPENFDKTIREVGNKYYELSNHLGNVLEVVTDRKIPNIAGTSYESDIISYSDYYPFGMLLPNRHESSNSYRYGFNGQEKDDEVLGEGNSYDFGARMYNNRIGKFLSLDPKASFYSYLSPYSFAGNSPIIAIDKDGEAPLPVHLYSTGIKSDFPKATADDILKWQELYYEKYNKAVAVEINEGQAASLKYKMDLFYQVAAKSREHGWGQAASNLEHYLNGGGDLTVDHSFFTKYQHTLGDMEMNINRFFEHQAESYEYTNIGDLADGLADGESKFYGDHYNTVVRTVAGDRWGDNPSNELPQQKTELSYAFGDFTITSTASLTITRSGDKFLMSGYITNVFSDEYDWHGYGFNVEIFGVTINDTQLSELKDAGAKEYSIISTEYNVKIKEGSYFTKNSDGTYDYSNVTFVYE